MPFKNFILRYRRSKADPMTGKVTDKDLATGRLANLYSLVVKYNELHIKAAPFETLKRQLLVIAKESDDVWEGKRSRWYHVSVQTKHDETLYVLSFDLKAAALEIIAAKAKSKKKETPKKYTITVTPPEEEVEEDEVDDEEDEVDDEEDEVDDEEDDSEVDESGYEADDESDEVPPFFDPELLHLGWKPRDPRMEIRREDPPIDPVPSPDKGTTSPPKIDPHKIKLEELVDFDWDERSTEDIDYLSKVLVLGRSQLRTHGIDKFVICHRESWDKWAEPVQYILNFRRRNRRFFMSKLWKKLTTAKSGAAFRSWVIRSLAGPKKLVAAAKRPWMLASYAACIDDWRLKAQLREAVETDQFMKGTVGSDVLWSSTEDTDIQLVRTTSLSIEERREALRRLLAVQANLGTNAGQFTGDDLETIESLGMTVSQLVAIGDATYTTLTSGKSAMNYLGPSVYGMPIECLFSILSIANMIRKPGDDVSEILEKSTVLTTKLAKTGIDTTRAIGSLEKHGSTIVPKSTLATLAGVSSGISIATGLYEIVQAKGEWKKAASMKERFELLGKHDPKFAAALSKLPKTAPLRMFHDEIVHGKLGRRKIRAFVRGIGGLTSIGSGAYVLALTIGASAIPVVGWGLVAAGVLLTLGTVTYSSLRRKQRESEYTKMRMKSVNWHYPRFIKTVGEYHRAVIAAYLHRTLCNPKSEAGDRSLAEALAWVMFGGSPSDSVEAVQKAAMAGITELLKG